MWAYSVDILWVVDALIYPWTLYVEIGAGNKGGILNLPGEESLF